jgi:predicted dehydrogenase
VDYAWLAVIWEKWAFAARPTGLTSSGSQVGEIRCAQTAALLGSIGTSKGIHVTLKVALIGCGKAADMHVSGIRRLNAARIVAVGDLEPLMAEQLAARHGIANCYSDFDKLLAMEKPDVVHIATPPQSHFSLARSAIDAGCHLMVEKPLAIDSRQAAQLIAYAERHARKLTIGYTYYFDPVVRMLRRLVRENVMGEVVHLESFLGYDLNGSFASPVLADRDHWVHGLAARLFHNVLDHLLNKITEFLTDEKTLVQAYSWQMPGRDPDLDYDLPDELRVAVIGEKKSAYVTFSSHSRPLRHSLTFYGTKNTAHLDFLNSTITLSRDSALPGVLGRLASPFSQGWQYFREGRRNVLRFARSEYHFFEGFNYLLSEFYGSIEHDLPVPIPYREILRVATLIDEIANRLRSQEARIE